MSSYSQILVLLHRKMRKACCVFVMLLMALAGNLAFSADYKPLPIPTGPNVVRWSDVHQRTEKYMLRTIFLSIHKHNTGKPWADEANLWAREYCAAVNDLPQRQTKTEVQGLALQLTRKGCNEPVLVSQKLQYESEGFPIEKQRIKEDWIGVHKSLTDLGYHMRERVVAALGYVKFLDASYPEFSVDPVEYKAALQLLCDDYIALMSEKDEDQFAQNTMALELIVDITESKFTNQAKAIKAGVIKESVSKLIYEKLFSDHNLGTPFMRSAVMGIIVEKFAWNARGEGLAANVTDDGWKAFRKHLDDAAQYLEAAWKIDPSYPVVPAHMIRVSAGLSNGEMRLWFDRTLSAQAEYWPAFGVMFNFLLPRWGGSHEEMEALGLEAFNTGEFTTENPYQYFIAILDIIEDMSDNNERMNFLSDPVRQKRIEKILPAILDPKSESISPDRRARAASWYALYLCIVGKIDRAHEVLTAIPVNQRNFDAFNNWGLNPYAIIDYKPENQPPVP